MAAPIFVDDGGSIRIKLALENENSAGVMDALFDVDASHRSSHKGDPDYTQVLVFYLDKHGALVNETGGPVGFTKVKIISDYGFEIEAQNIGAPNAKFELGVSGGNVDPIIESKQHKKKRGYTVVNGGRIDTIEIDLASGGTRSIPVPSKTIYTAVVLT